MTARNNIGQSMLETLRSIESEWIEQEAFSEAVKNISQGLKNLNLTDPVVIIDSTAEFEIKDRVKKVVNSSMSGEASAAFDECGDYRLVDPVVYQKNSGKNYSSRLLDLTTRALNRPIAAQEVTPGKKSNKPWYGRFNKK